MVQHVQKDVKEFENLDKMFFRKLLGVPVSTPTEAFCLELGVLDINTIIKSRRINYLHSILRRNKNSMLYSFFFTQWNNQTKGDWTEIVRGDLEDFQIPCSLDSIAAKSKESFKNLVKGKVKDFSLKKLKTEQSKHSKMKELHYSDLKIQNYLTDPNLTPNQMRTIFRYRTRMEKFGENFRGGKLSVTCPLCRVHLDNQAMSFHCSVIKDNIDVNGDISDVYGENISMQTVDTIMKITEIRKSKLDM